MQGKKAGPYHCRVLPDESKDAEVLFSMSSKFIILSIVPSESKHTF